MCGAMPGAPFAPSGAVRAEPPPEFMPVVWVERVALLPLVEPMLRDCSAAGDWDDGVEVCA